MDARVACPEKLTSPSYTESRSARSPHPNEESGSEAPAHLHLRRDGPAGHANGVHRRARLPDPRLDAGPDRHRRLPPFEQEADGDLHRRGRIAGSAALRGGACQGPEGLLRSLDPGAQPRQPPGRGGRRADVRVGRDRGAGHDGADRAGPPAGNGPRRGPGRDHLGQGAHGGRGRARPGAGSARPADPGRGRRFGRAPAPAQERDRGQLRCRRPRRVPQRGIEGARHRNPPITGVRRARSSTCC